MSKPLKAYQVREGDEGHCVIVFATNGAAARRMGAGELEIDFSDVEECRRRPAFDGYAPGPVPRLALLEAGWWFDCSCVDCERRINLVDEEEEDEDGNPLPKLDPVALGESVFCNAACMARQCAWWRGRAAAEASMCELIYTRWPLATITRVHVYGDRLEQSEPSRGLLSGCWFKLPDLTYDVQYRFGDLHYYVARCDADTFASKYGTQKVTQ